MARAKVELTCQTCGKRFEVKKEVWNRKAANEYEDWAEENIVECPECRKARKLSVDHTPTRMHYSDYKNFYPKSDIVVDSYDKNGKTIEVWVENKLIENYPEQKRYADTLNLPELQGSIHALRVAESTRVRFCKFCDKHKNDKAADLTQPAFEYLVANWNTKDWSATYGADMKGFLYYYLACVEQDKDRKELYSQRARWHGVEKEVQ